MKLFSEETRRKMSESAKRRCQTKEWKEKQADRGLKLDIDKFKELYYEKNMTQTEVAKEFVISQKAVFGFMRRNNLPARTAAKRYQRGEKNSSWKGGRRVTEQGYVEIYRPDYEHARSNGYVREHIYVVENRIGRRLKFYGVGNPNNEVVHHINGKRDDNRLENLLLLTAAEHSKLHFSTDKQALDEVLLKRIADLEEEIARLIGEETEYVS